MAIILGGVFMTVGWAQESRATLRGQVTDPTGAVVVGAAVIVTSDDTNVKQETKTNDQGAWSAHFLIPGHYSISVSFAGFKTVERRGITLDTSDDKEIDSTLEVGSASQKVEVTAEAPLIDTTSATSGTVITPQQMTEIPILSRIPTLLAGLSPGVLLQDQNQNVPRMWSVIAASQILVNGGRDQRSNDFTLDGQPNTEGEGGGRISFIPPLDSVAEFKIMSNAYDAQYGRQAGSTMNMSLKSGTKNYHGTLYEFNQTATFNAVPFHFNTTSPAQPTPPVHYNLYGATLGGPVFIPRVYHGKDKTFFFFNFEGTRNQDPRGGIRSVPTALERQGDFSQSFSTSAGQCFSVRAFDPNLVNTNPGPSFGFRPEFPRAGNICPNQTPDNRQGDIIPPERISPMAKAILQFVPLPNTPSSPGSNATNNFVPSSTRQNKMAAVVVRVDHNWNNQHKTYGNVHWNHETERLDNFFGNVSTGAGPNQRIAKGINLDHVWTFSPSKILDIRYGLTRWEEPTQDNGAGFDPTQLGFPSSFVSQLRVPSFPRIVGLFGDIGTDNGGAYDKDTYHTWNASITQVHGNMQFHYGGEIRANQEAHGAIGNQGRYEFNGNWTRQVAQGGAGIGGSTLGSFLLGLPSSGFVPRNADRFLSQHYYAVFLQNDWRVTPRLTLNMGLRWDVEGPFTERYNRLTDNFDPTAPNPISDSAQARYAAILASHTSDPVYQQLAQLVPASSFQIRGAQLFTGVNGQPPGAVSQHDYREFQPRVGFAYRLRPHTVIRGGFGRFVQSTSLRGGQNGFSRTTDFTATTDNFLTPFDTLANPYRNGLLAPTGSSLGPLTNLGQGVNWDNQNPDKPYSWEYSFHLQQEYKGWLFEAGYSHNQTYNIYWGRDQNNPSFDLWKQLRAPRFDQGYINTHPTCMQTTSCRPADRLLADELIQNPFQNLPGMNGGVSTSATRNLFDLIRPLPYLGGVTENANPLGQNTFDALELKAERRFHKGLSMLAAFTWSKLYEDTAFIGPEIAGPIVEHKLGGEDRPYRLSLAPIYELPVGRGKRYLTNSPRVVDAVLGGWELTGQWLIQSGTPIVLTYNNDTNSLYFWDGQNFALPRDQRTLNKWFDTSHFFKIPGRGDDVFGFCDGTNVQKWPTWTGVQNLPGANYDPSKDIQNNNKTACANGTRNGVFQDFGNVVRTMPTRFGFARSSRVNEWNLGVYKNFPIRERLRGQFRLEAFNAFNHPRFGGPNTDPGSSQFGQVSKTQLNTPRLIQFALKLNF
jgi:hypothetical protein